MFLRVVIKQPKRNQGYWLQSHPQDSTSFLETRFCHLHTLYTRRQNFCKTSEGRSKAARWSSRKNRHFDLFSGVKTAWMQRDPRNKLNLRKETAESTKRTQTGGTAVRWISCRRLFSGFLFFLFSVSLSEENLTKFATKNLNQRPYTRHKTQGFKCGKNLRSVFCVCSIHVNFHVYLLGFHIWCKTGQRERSDKPKMLLLLRHFFNEKRNAAKEQDRTISLFFPEKNVPGATFSSFDNWRRIKQVERNPT